MNYLITADLHLRDDCPACRADYDWWESQAHDLIFLVETANNHNARLLIAGDIFHRPNVSEKLLLHTYEILALCRHGVRTIAGNHDLPNHMIEKLSECSYGVLAELLKTTHLHNGASDGDGVLGFNWRCDIPNQVIAKSRVKSEIALTHLTIVSGIPIAAEKTVDPKEVFKWLPGIPLVVAGDIHRHALHIHEASGRVLLIPGSLNVQVSDMQDYEPVVHLLKDGDMQKIKIPQDNAKYIEKVDLREKQKSSIAESIGKIGEQSVYALFYENLRNSNPSKKEKDYINAVLTETKGDPLWN